jgi:cellulose synthase/poly-beta-1,6-N-acetylglucosamine synthase-like glycosyltransferase
MGNHRVVCILAHNEEDRSEHCLSSLPISDQCFVVVDGSTDRTSEKFHVFLQDHSNVRVIDLKPAGKSRPWNTFIYDYAPRTAEIFFFIDSDAVIKQGSLDAMASRSSLSVTSIWSVGLGEHRRTVTLLEFL